MPLRSGDVRFTELLADPIRAVREAYAQLGRAFTPVHADAIRAYERALEIDRNNVFAWKARGDLAARQGDRASVETAVRALRTLYPPYAEQLAAPR